MCLFLIFCSFVGQKQKERIWVKQGYIGQISQKMLQTVARVTKGRVAAHHLTISLGHYYMQNLASCLFATSSLKPNARVLLKSIIFYPRKRWLDYSIEQQRR